MVAQSSPAALTAEGLSELSRESVESNERAVELFDRALGFDAGFAPAYMGLATAYVQRTDDLRLGLSWLDSAVKAGKWAIELDPRLGEAYLALGRAYRLKGWLREELQLWEQRVQLDPSDADVWERLGWVLWFTGRAEEALPRLKTAVELRPQRAWTHFFLGNANLALGDYGEAERMYRRALELQPENSSAQAGVIWSLLAAHIDEEARSHLHRFQAGTFDGDRYSVKVADIEYFLGEDENASRHAREGLAEPPRDSTMRGAERYWPRGFLASTILGALLWNADRASAEEQLGYSERIDRERLEGGDQGYLPHIDLAAVEAIRGNLRTGCRWLGTAIAAGWHFPSLAARDRLFENLRTDHEFQSLVGA